MTIVGIPLAEFISTVAIILTLGGLEFTLWFIQHKSEKSDRALQERQLQILEDMLSETEVIADVAENEDKS
jgi:hypothetical protein